MEIPFGRYYGSHDATPLFVMLADAYYRQTGDLELSSSSSGRTSSARWPGSTVRPTPTATDSSSTRDAAPTGLAHQGWKDSDDSVFHADGRLAEGPIALCEIQGYVYAARLGAADLADALGHDGRARRAAGPGRAPASAFEEAFWVEELGTYGIALDGDKRLCRVPDLEPRTLPLRSGIA